MVTLLADPKYDFVSERDKAFVAAFDSAMKQAGYTNDGIQPYVTFGKYKVEYYKAGVKTKKVVARFYFRDDETVLRLYFTNIDKYRGYIENAPPFIKDSFTNEHARCKHCENGFNKDGKCNFRKTYTIDGETIEKCSGDNFYFRDFSVENIPVYMELLNTFYPTKTRK